MKHLLSLLILFLATCLKVSAQVDLCYTSSIDYGWGDAGAVVTPYVSFSTDYLHPYVGNQITKVSIGLKEEATNCYIYLKNSPEDSQSIYRQKVDRLEKGWNEITLDTPFMITDGEKLAIGYKASFQKASGVGLSSEKFAEADNVYYNSRNQWVTAGGSVCIKAFVEGENMPVNDLAVSRLKNIPDLSEGNTYAYEGYVRNMGVNEITSYTLEVLLDGETVETITGSNLVLNSRQTFSFSVGSEDAGSHNVEVRVAGVNGTDDSNSLNNLSAVTFTVRDSRFLRRIVCEEFTGTWCGFCPRGIVGLELMKEEHPDHFIAICVHGNDQMQIDPETDYSYAEFIESVAGAPFCNLDRRMTGDPYNNIQNLYNLESIAENHYALEATGVWSDDGKSLDIDYSVMTDTDIKNATVNVAYTIVESGITGYLQTNYYAGGRNGEMYGWEEKTDPTADVVFNDVARAIIGGYRGKSLISGNITAYENNSFTDRVTLTDNVTNPANAAVIVQLIDASTNQILNAALLNPQRPSEVNAVVAAHGKVSAVQDGICISAQSPLMATVYTADGTLIGHYDADGETVISLPKGMYIVTLSENGSAVNVSKIII